MKAEDFLKEKKIGQTFVSTKDKNGYIALTDLLEEFLKAQETKGIPGENVLEANSDPVSIITQKQLKDELKSLLRRGIRLAAIKAHYAYYGGSLKESKRIIDEMWYSKSYLK